MLASIIVTTRDEDPARLNATFEGLRATIAHSDVELILVDDGSINPVRPEGALSDRVRLLRLPEPLGVSDARRTGALLARGEYLVWIDAHMSFGAHWLEQMLVQASVDAVVCSPFWTYELDRCLCWGADFVWNPVRDYAAGKYPGLALRHRTEPPSAAAVEVPMIIGACYAMRRSACAALGGLCPHFRVWGIDEQDICALAWMAGMRVVCATHAQAGHFSRPAFPYPVQYEHLEFNQAVMLHSVFERGTVQRLAQFFDPLPDATASWLAGIDLSNWRRSVQRRRKLSDAEFFRRFVPDLVPYASKRRAGRAQSA